MNYRHAFHAGNFADVFKHLILSRILVYLARKPAPFRYIDTHAGIGLYDLDGEEARRGAEWPNGIGRINAKAIPPEILPLAEPYLALVGPRDAVGRPSLYPGSPLLAMGLTRPQDKLIFCELHPADAGTLRAAVGRSARAKVVSIDGYTALKAFVPPPERRGLVLVDPPFEARSEFDDMLDGVVAAHRKWPTGLYALWYPAKDPAAVARFARGLAESGIPRIAQIELFVARPETPEASGLTGCGLILINPPHIMAAEAAVLMPFLCTVLGRSEPGSWQWRWLAEE